MNLLDDRAARYVGAVASVDGFEVDAARYEARQLTSAQVFEALVGRAKKLRDARDRREQVGLPRRKPRSTTRSRAAPTTCRLTPTLAAIAHDLVGTLRNGKLRVDWTDHACSQAAVRRIIKRLLRKHHYEP